ncbi:MAG: RHS repeat-associated core domain-containing protein, partial [Candidatus Ornithomonoglobus sp.]
LWYLDYDYVGNVKQSLEAYAYRDYTYGPFGLTSAYYHLRGSTKKEYTYNSLGMITGTKNTDIVWGEDQSFTGKPTISTVTSESYTYDGFGRVKTQTSNDGSVQSYTYDNNSNVTAYKLTKDGVTKNSISYGYNKLNQLTSLTKDGIITSYEYDSVGNLTSKMNNKNIGTEYVYNNAGLVTSVKNKVNGTYTNYEVYGYYLNGLKYNESDIGIDMLFTNHYRYDNTGKLIREIENIGGKKLCDSTYTYDLRGNRLSKNDTVSNENTTYTYDLADHLLRADTSVNNTLTSRKLYTYDERGNLTAEQTRVYSSDGLSGSSISMTTGDTKLYSYDRFNRLTKYRSGSTEATYEYTADNLRASKTVNGKKTNFVWSGMNLMYEYGAQTNSYAYDNTGILQSGTDTYLKDGHGNVIAKYNSAGTKLSSTEYDAFGNIISGALSDSFGYCGEYLDSESGLIYLRNRYYDTATGRFISEDPVKSGVNWYSYCGGNPVTLFDPWGLTFVTGVNCFVVGGDYYELPDKYTDTYTTFDTSIINQNDAIVFEDSGDNVNLFAFLNYSGENNQKIIENDFENTGLTYNQIFTQAVQDGWSGYVDYFGSNLRVNSYAIMVTGVNNTEAKKYCIKVNFTNEVSASEADVSMTPYKGEITMYKGMAEDLIYSPAIFRLTAMHEFGHILGLADCYHIGDPNIRTIMNNYYEFANREIKGPLNIDFAAMLRVRSQGKKLWSKMDDEFTKYYKDENWDQIIQK